MISEAYKFANELGKVGRSKRTIEEYMRRINTFAEFFFDHRDAGSVLDATRSDVLRYYEALKSSNRSNRTVNAMMTTVSVFFRMAVRLGKIKVSPVPNGLHIKVSIPDTPRMSDSQLSMLKSWFDTLQPNLRAAFWCMYGSGCRVGEAAHLKYSDVFIRNGALYINITRAKWASDRVIPVMVPQAAKVLYEYLKTERPSNEPLFHVSRRTLQDYARKFANSTGLKFHCHMLRHNFATRLYEYGLPLRKIQKLLGHRSIMMTMHYISHAKQDLTDYVPRVFSKEVTDHE